MLVNLTLVCAIIYFLLVSVLVILIGVKFCISWHSKAEKNNHQKAVAAAVRRAREVKK